MKIYKWEQIKRRLPAYRTVRIAVKVGYALAVMRVKEWWKQQRQ